MSDKLMGGIKAGATDLSLNIVLRKTADNTEQTAKVAADMTLSYWRQGGTRTAVAASDLAAVDSAHADGGVKEVDATNLPGLYRVDWPDAAFATGADWVVLSVKVASCYVVHERFVLASKTAKDNNDELVNATYGLAKLVRSTTPANTLGVDASGQVAANNAALSNLDAAITTRAPAATALSNATWTDGKAGYLDAAVTSRPTAAEVKTAMEAVGGHLYRTYLLSGGGKLTTVDATGAWTLTDAGGTTTAATGTIGDNLTNTVRSLPTWV